MTVVVIWNNNLAGSQTYVGHSSMLIGKTWSRTKPSYVSYWPENGAGLFDSENSLVARNFLKDLEFEGYAPDHVIQIHDLNTALMQAEWDLIRLKQNGHYQMVRKNCSTVVARVLKKGAKIGSYFKRHNAIWTPLKVKRLAFEMLGEEKGWAWMLNEARMDGLITATEATMLANLRKRDDRHGQASGTASYYANGQAIAPKQTFMSSGNGQRPGFQIGAAPGRAAWYADGGNLYGGQIVPSPTGMDFQRD
ncbi:hypothetical protein [Muricoccus radiodurans]|uniref:hypothetical protein n=1 Tax=Muricoccus radiodurans TaxID=2231721 RepID=UPI003CEB66E5